MNPVISEIRVHQVEIPLLRPFVTAVRETSHISSLIIEVRDSSGRSGWGEAVANWKVTGESPASIRAVVADPLTATIIGQPPAAVLEAELLAQAVAHNASARAAVECAVHDLAAQEAGLSLAGFLGYSTLAVRTDMTLSIASSDELVARAKDFYEQGFTTLKIKVGPAPEHVEAVLAVRAALPDAALRVDANQAWSPRQAITHINTWQERGARLDFVEQPVDAPDISGLATVTRNVDTPIMADEAVRTISDLEQVISQDAAQLINVKLAKTGGLREAQRVITQAHDHGITPLMGSMMESTVGLTAAAALAGAEPEEIHDLDAGLWQSHPIIDGGITYANNRVRLPQAPGLGICRLEVPTDNLVPATSLPTHADSCGGTQ